MIKVSNTEATISFLMECYFKLHKEKNESIQYNYGLTNEIWF